LFELPTPDNFDIDNWSLLFRAFKASRSLLSALHPRLTTFEHYGDVGRVLPPAPGALPFDKERGTVQRSLPNMAVYT